MSHRFKQGTNPAVGMPTKNVYEKEIMQEPIMQIVTVFLRPILAGKYPPNGIIAV